jgi:hypothetical protein
MNGACDFEELYVHITPCYTTFTKNNMVILNWKPTMEQLTLEHNWEVCEVNWCNIKTSI